MECFANTFYDLWSYWGGGGGLRKSVHAWFLQVFIRFLNEVFSHSANAGPKPGMKKRMGEKTFRFVLEKAKVTFFCTSLMKLATLFCWQRFIYCSKKSKKPCIGLKRIMLDA